VTDELLTVTDCARITRRHRKTIERALRAGDLQGVQYVPGGRWYVEPSALDRYLTQHRAGHAARGDVPAPAPPRTQRGKLVVMPGMGRP
jgi:Helix-turn-helix domain